MITEHNTSNQINTGCLRSLHPPQSIYFVFLFIYDPHPPSLPPHTPSFSIFSRPLSLYIPLFIIYLKFLILLHRPPGLTGSPVISDISLIRLSPHTTPGTGESPFSPPHPYVSPHMEHYLRSVHGSPTLSMISAARGLSPAEGKIYPTCRYFSHAVISLCLYRCSICL